jgi:hypothetical protein
MIAGDVPIKDRKIMKETAIITLQYGSQDNLEKALAMVATYLEQSAYCQQFALVSTLSENGQAILRIEWRDASHRALAWYYFSNVLADAGVVVHIALEGQAAQRKIA